MNENFFILMHKTLFAYIDLEKWKVKIREIKQKQFNGNLEKEQTVIVLNLKNWQSI